MSYLDLSTGFRVAGQFPQDGKLYFSTISQMKNLGNNNLKALSYYDLMIVMCLQNKLQYIWREAVTVETGLLDDNYVYPNGSIANGINYSGKSYNFFPYKENLLTLLDLYPDDGIHTGRLVWREGTLIFDSVNFSFVIGGVEFYPPNSVLTLSPGHSTYGRFDTFVVDYLTGNVKVLQGTPSATPVEEAVLFGSQIRINSVFIPANATSPQVNEGENFVIDIITDETDSEPEEWNNVTIPVGANLNVTTDPGTNAKSIYIPANTTGKLEYKKATAISWNGQDLLKFRMKLGAPMLDGTFATASVIKFGIHNTPHTKTGEYNTTHYSLALQGLNNNSLEWQDIVIPMNSIRLNTTGAPETFDSFYIQCDRCPIIYFDNIRIVREVPVVVATQVNPDWNSVSGKSEILNHPCFIRVGGYLVDNRGVRSTTIKAGNIIYGKGIFFDGEYIIAEALVDNPSDNSHFKTPYLQSL